MGCSNSQDKALRSEVDRLHSCMRLTQLRLRNLSGHYKVSKFEVSRLQHHNRYLLKRYNSLYEEFNRAKEDQSYSTSSHSRENSFQDELIRQYQSEIKSLKNMMSRKDNLIAKLQDKLNK